MTFFGEEHFIEDTMINICKQQRNYIDNSILDAIKNECRFYVDIDRDKLKRWLELCSKLEKIDKSDLIDFAIQKKFDELNTKIEKIQEENAVLKKALELFSIATCTGARPDLTNKIKQFTFRQQVVDYFIQQAKESIK